MSHSIHHPVRRGAAALLIIAVAAVGLFVSTISVSAQSTPAEADSPRIVTLGGSITEVVFSLGSGSDVVAVDASSVYPEAVRQIPRLGYFRAVSAEGVLSVNPSLVLARHDSGPAVALDQVRAAGIPVVLIPFVPSEEGAKNMIQEVADAIGRPDDGTALIASLNRDLKEVPLPSAGANTPSVLFIYARGGGTLNVSGTGTAADAMIKLAGGQNAVTAYEGYRPLTAESVVSAAPDVILMVDRGLESVGGVAGLLEVPGIALTPAGRSRHIVSMDDALILSFGPRLGEAVTELHSLLNPASN